MNVIQKIEAIKPFSEAEAWWLFKTAAISEAIGWTLLICGILIHHYKLFGYRYSIQVTGQIHGTIFLIYFGILIAAYSSLSWPRSKFIVGLIAGVPPYGTLIFEIIASRQRQHRSCKAFYCSTILQFVNINKDLKFN